MPWLLGFVTSLLCVPGQLGDVSGLLCLLLSSALVVVFVNVDKSRCYVDLICFFADKFVNLHYN